MRKEMKLIAYVSWVLTYALLAGAGISALQPFSLSILQPQGPFRPGSPVELIVTLANRSVGEIVIRDKNRWCDYELEVRESRGQRPPETSYKRELKCNNKFVVTTGKNSIRTLKPHESYSDLMIVNQLYDLSRPGEYTIQVSRLVPPGLGGGTVKSNVITVTITE
jgi:hypothetical protein